MTVSVYINNEVKLIDVKELKYYNFAGSKDGLAVLEEVSNA